MKAAFFGIIMLGLLAGGSVGGWAAMNYYAPGQVGTPSHAGAVSNGKPMQCTNVNFTAKARTIEEHVALIPAPGLVRGTFEAQGGFGRVDVLLRVRDPQNLEILASPKTDNYDFTFPVHIKGEYVFAFDNRYSLYTSKSIGLYYCLDTGAAPQPTPFGPY